MGEDTWNFVGHAVRADELDLIRSIVDEFGGLSRVELAATVCELLGWTRAYGVTPVLLETLLDPRRFDGASYRAANWIVVGTTTGRGRNDRDRRAVRVPKRVLIYPLVPDAAHRLRGH